MDVSGIAAQQAIFRLNLGMEMLKSQNNAQQSLVNMITATVDATRGQNLDITV